MSVRKSTFFIGFAVAVACVQKVPTTSAYIPATSRKLATKSVSGSISSPTSSSSLYSYLDSLSRSGGNSNNNDDGRNNQNSYGGSASTTGSTGMENSWADSLSSAAPEQPQTQELPTELAASSTVDEEILSFQYSGKKTPPTQATKTAYENAVEAQVESAVDYSKEESIAELMTQVGSPTTEAPAQPTIDAPAPPVFTQPQTSTTTIVQSSPNTFSFNNKNDDDDEEEAVSYSLGSTISSSLSPATSQTYISSRLSLSESRTKNEKRLSRSLHEIEKTAETIEQIKRRAQEQVKEAEEDLADKLQEIQNNIDAETDRVMTLLRNQIQFERNREQKLVKLTWALQAAIIAKDEEIKNDERTTAEMTDLRNKMADSAISAQLDVVVAQKEALGSIDRCQLANLNEILEEAQRILKGTRSLLILIEDSLAQVLPMTAGDKVYDFSHLTKLESVWKSASDVIIRNEARMNELKARYDTDRLNKLMLLGEPIPESLQNAAKRVETRALNVASSSNLLGTETSSGIVPAGSQIVSMNGSVLPPVLKVEDLQTKDEGEIAGVLAKAVGKAAIASAKAGAFGIKALFDTFRDEEVTKVTGEVVKSSSELSKVSQGLSEGMKNASAGKNFTNDDLSAGFKSTGDTFGAIGKVGQVVATKVRTTDSAKQANEAIQETSNDIVEAFNAVTALSKKLLNRNNESDGNSPRPPFGM